MYVDFANPWLVADFERQAEGSDVVVFEEALPDPDQALHRDPDGGIVTEFLIEITDAEGEHD